jgi:hypothetical protein
VTLVALAKNSTASHEWRKDGIVNVV